VYATGLRNAFDLVKTQSGKLYTFDNGPNSGWGGTPASDCANDRDDNGATDPDSLHLLTEGYYGGHPNPTRGNKDNTFNDSNPQSPIVGPANPIECDYQEPGNGDSSLTTIAASTNGIDEYTASNFGSAMKGDLVTVGFDKTLRRFQLNGAGTQVTSKSILAEEFGRIPLGIVAQGDNDLFPGTIWIAHNVESMITVFEPADY